MALGKEFHGFSYWERAEHSPVSLRLREPLAYLPRKKQVRLLSALVSQLRHEAQGGSHRLTHVVVWDAQQGGTTENQYVPEFVPSEAIHLIGHRLSCPGSVKSCHLSDSTDSQGCSLNQWS